MYHLKVTERDICIRLHNPCVQQPHLKAQDEHRLLLQ